MKSRMRWCSRFTKCERVAGFVKYAHTTGVPRSGLVQKTCAITLGIRNIKMATLELGRVAKVGDICFVTLYLVFLNDHPLFDILMRRSFDYLRIYYIIICGWGSCEHCDFFWLKREFIGCPPPYICRKTLVVFSLSRSSSSFSVSLFPPVEYHLA